MDAHRYILNRAIDHHPPIADLVRHTGILDCHQPTSSDLFEFLARTVVGQQLSSTAARTIWQRLEALRDAEGVHLRRLMSPGYLGKISACGLSKNKVKALSLLDVAFEDALLSNESLQAADYEQVVETITSLWGFGQWSADMVAMFYLNMPDIWPEQDVALSRGLRILVPDEDSSKASFVYAPERTYLARHIWIGLDTGRIKL